MGKVFLDHANFENFKLLVCVVMSVCYPDAMGFLAIVVLVR